MEMRTLKSLLDTQRFLDTLRERTEAGDESAVDVSEQIRYKNNYAHGSQFYLFACLKLADLTDTYLTTRNESVDTYLPEGQPAAI